MGILYVEGVVTGATGKQGTARFLVDSGATYTLLSFDVWRAIELLPQRSVIFTLADGTTIERQVSECYCPASGARPYSRDSWRAGG